MANCAELRAMYEKMVIEGAPVLIKSGDQLVKYTSADKLLEVIEKLCGPWQPEGSTANREIRMHANRVQSSTDCGCSNDGSDGWD